MAQGVGEQGGGRRLDRCWCVAGCGGPQGGCPGEACGREGGVRKLAATWTSLRDGEVRRLAVMVG